jgi:hypothetical protein
VTSPADQEWRRRAAAAAFASHRLVGWIFWDPDGIAGYAALGVPDGTGYYVATRAAPLAGDDGSVPDEAVIAAFGSIHHDFIRVCLELCRANTTFAAATAVRDEAVVAGLRRYVPDLCEPLAELAEPLWEAVDTLRLDGRPFFASHLRHRCEDVPLLSAWLAVNAMREWRGDTHWAIHNAEGIDGDMAMLLDAAWRGHDDDWLPKSRGADDAALARAMDALAARGLADGGRVNASGIAHRQELEDRLDDLCVPGWQAFGHERTEEFVDLMSPHGAALIERVDRTAGPRWMPAGRERRTRQGET